MKKSVLSFLLAVTFGLAVVAPLAASTIARSDGEGGYTPCQCLCGIFMSKVVCFCVCDKAE